jgi:predicted ATPase
MTAWILAAARTQAIVLAFEDLHWADPTSLDLMRALAERGARAPLLIIATARPEFRAPWSVRSHHSVISLSPLDSAEIAKMVRDLSSRHALPKDIVEEVSERTGGVPLFVEEVTRLLLERGEQGGTQAIPPTLQQSLAARLDRLGAARETAQIGAVLGRGFSYALIQSVAGLDGGALRSALERLAEADILFVEGDGAQATYRFKHALIQDAAYDSLLKSSRQALHAQVAEILSQSASPEPEAIAHHFTQAGLEDQAIEWWGKAGDQALRRSAFQEAISHLGKAIAMADKASGGKLADMSRERQHLHAAYGNALIAARGPGAPETTQVFTRARERAGGDKGAPERLAVDYGLFVGSLVRGELLAMRAHAAAFLADVEGGPHAPEAGVAYRAQGITHWFAGEYVRAREHLERALSLFEPGRDDDLAFRFGYDAGASAMAYLAFASWSLGDVGRARFLIESIKARIESVAHAGSRASGTALVAHFELMRGDSSRVPQHAKELARLASEHNLSMFRAYGAFLEGWAGAHFGGLDEGLEGMRHGVEALRGQNVVLLDGLIKIALAKAEARAGDFDRAAAILGEALATSERTGHLTFDAELHRARGEILLKRDPANSAPAEEAFLTAIAVAQGQKARSFELRAALSLAKLYQSTARPIEAHAVLAPALEGFSPTPEMPEIAEAVALLASLSEMEEVKAAEAQRRRRLHLQTAYGQAMMWAKGFAAEETQAAFSRATELTAKSDDFAERFAAAHFQWTRAFLRGELRSARELESSFLKEAEDMGRVVEAGVARRGLALACYQASDFQEARIHCERALEACEPDHERETQERFHDATGPIVMSVLAVTMWQLGEPERAREMIEQANRRGRDLGHGPSMTHPLFWRSHLEILRGDAAVALPQAEALADLGLKRGMPFWRTAGEMSAGWARGRVRDAEDGAADLRRALAERAAQGASDGWLHTVLLAELEAETLGAQRALERIEEAMALVRHLENRCNLSFPYLLRGELLLKCDPPSPAGAEEAFQSAISIARDQGARSWGLRAALALAKLYQSTDRPIEAHAVLGPALEGFSPTSQMPEIAEAQALLGRLA